MKYKKETLRREFTLVEMLIVVGIASLLFTLVIPAFSRMMQGSRVEHCASNIKLGMERARAKAVSGRRYIAMVLPHGVSSRSRADYDFQRGGYRLFYVSIGSNGTFTCDGVVPEMTWSNRSNEAYLVAVSDEQKKISDYKTAKVGDSNTKEKIIDSGFLHTVSGLPVGGSASPVSLPGLIFSPYGDIRANTDQTELYFYVCGTDKDDMLCLRMNKITGKIEYVSLEL